MIKILTSHWGRGMGHKYSLITTVIFKEKVLIKPISLHRQCFSFSLACPYQAYGPQVGPGHSDLGYSPLPLSDS